LHARLPEARFLVPLATRETHALFQAAIWRASAVDLPITVMHGHASQALTAADLGLVASGTATLEAALCGCPMVVTYRLSGLTAWLVRRRKHLAYVSLPNILAGDWMVPELLQEDATVDNLARALINLWHDRALRRALEDRFRELHRSLRSDTDAAVQLALAGWLDALPEGMDVALVHHAASRAPA
jgi:lipid-A-disaccharide synthase